MVYQYIGLKQCVEQARRDIIHGDVDGAHKRVFDRMTFLTQEKIFEDKDLELLPAYLLLAEANICMGGHKLGKAEEFLIAANWNLLKHEPEDQKDGENKTFVTPKEMISLDGTLHKTFGRLFLEQFKDPKKESMFAELDRKAIW